MAVGADGAITAASLGMAADATRLLEAPGGNSRGLPRGGDGSASGAEDESMAGIGNVDGQLRASALRRLTEMVERHPEESLTIMRAWMQQGHG